MHEEQDTVEGDGMAAALWPHFINDAYPQLADLDLGCTLLAICMRTYMNRISGAAVYESIETFSGFGAITFGMISKLDAHAVQFDIKHDNSHDCTSKDGITLWLQAIQFAKKRCLLWMGTKCSSFVAISSSKHKRKADNAYFGDTSKAFVRLGNGLMAVSSLLFFLGGLLDLVPVVEQPVSSCLPKIAPMRTVLTFGNACSTTVWLGTFGAPSPKPVKLWGSSPQFQALRRPKPDKENSEPSNSNAILTQKGISKKTGRATFSGKPNLTASEEYPFAFGLAVADVMHGILMEP